MPPAKDNSLKAYLDNGMMLNNVVDTIVEIQRSCVPIHFTKNGIEIAFQENWGGAGVNLVIPRWCFSSYHLQPPDKMYSIGVYLTKLQKLLHHCSHDDVVSFEMSYEDQSRWKLNRDDVTSSSFVEYEMPNVDIDYDVERSMQHDIEFHIRINSGKLKSIMQEFLKHNPQYVKVYMNRELIQFKIDSCDDEMIGNIVIQNQMPRPSEAVKRKRDEVDVDTKSKKAKRPKDKAETPDAMPSLSKQCVQEEEAKCEIEDSCLNASNAVQRGRMMQWKREDQIKKIIQRKEEMKRGLRGLKSSNGCKFVRFKKLYIKPVIKMCSLSTTVDIFITEKKFIVFRVVLTNDIEENIHAAAQVNNADLKDDESNIPILQLVFSHAIDEHDDLNSDEEGTTIKANDFAHIKLEDCGDDDAQWDDE